MDLKDRVKEWTQFIIAKIQIMWRSQIIGRGCVPIASLPIMNIGMKFGMIFMAQGGER